MSAQLELTDLRGILAPGMRRSHALAGNAVITIRGNMSRFTYKIKRSDDGQVHFVRVLTGPDNDSHYKFIGTLFKGGNFKHNWRGGIGPEAPSAVAFKWLVGHWEDARVQVWHEGTCGRCGRRLTVPESIETGLGPTCAGYSS